MPDQTLSQMQCYQYFKGRSGLTIGITEVLFNQHSKYQFIQVCETDVLGRMLLLDGLLMFTEYDEFVYHEMLAHTSSCLLGDPQNILVIGGGDGGTIRELLRHKCIKKVDLVEIDKDVIEASKQFFPAMSRGFFDPRVTVYIRDGIEFVKEARANTYDIIIIDGTDPVGFAAGLYEKSFHENCFRLLTSRGVFLTLSESPFDLTYADVVRKVRSNLRSVFPVAETFLVYIPTYTTGMWSFVFASKKLHPVRHFKPKQAAKMIKAFESELRYYNPETHLAAFVLPNFVKRLVDG
jgi:spermidine synthase